jgi:hypothetical protein
MGGERGVMQGFRAGKLCSYGVWDVGLMSGWRARCLSLPHVAVMLLVCDIFPTIMILHASRRLLGSSVCFVVYHT